MKITQQVLKNKFKTNSVIINGRLIVYTDDTKLVSRITRVLSIKNKANYVNEIVGNTFIIKPIFL